MSASDPGADYLLGYTDHQRYDAALRQIGGKRLTYRRITGTKRLKLTRRFIRLLYLV